MPTRTRRRPPSTAARGVLPGGAASSADGGPFPSSCLARRRSFGRRWPPRPSARGAQGGHAKAARGHRARGAGCSARSMSWRSPRARGEGVRARPEEDRRRGLLGEGRGEARRRDPRGGGGGGGGGGRGRREDGLAGRGARRAAFRIARADPRRRRARISVGDSIQGGVSLGRGGGGGERCRALLPRLRRRAVRAQRAFGCGPGPSVLRDQPDPSRQRSGRRRSSRRKWIPGTGAGSLGRVGRVGAARPRSRERPGGSQRARRDRRAFTKFSYHSPTRACAGGRRGRRAEPRASPPRPSQTAALEAARARARGGDARAAPESRRVRGRVPAGSLLLPHAKGGPLRERGRVPLKRRRIRIRIRIRTSAGGSSLRERRGGGSSSRSSSAGRGGGGGVGGPPPSASPA